MTKMTVPEIRAELIELQGNLLEYHKKAQELVSLSRYVDTQGRIGLAAHVAVDETDFRRKVAALRTAIEEYRDYDETQSAHYPDLFDDDDDMG